MKHFLTALLLLSVTPGFSQSGKALIKLSPVALVDEVGFPAIQAGVEFKLRERLTMYTEAAVKYRRGAYEDNDTNFVPSRGFRLKAELRRYLQNGAEAFNGTYLGANIFFAHDSHNNGISYYYQKDSSLERGDEFGVRKNILGINLLFGQQKIIRGRFYFDVYGGIGVRFRSIKATAKEFNRKRDAYHHTIDVTVDDTRSNIDAEVRNLPVMPNLTLGIRLCYSL